MRLLISLLFGAAFALAQSRVEGRVVTVSGEAVAKAEVTLAGGPANIAAASTDNDGKFVFAEVPSGRYTRLTAQKAGFVTQLYGARTNLAFGTVLTVTPGTDVKDLIIRMLPQGVISGHISDPDGDPAAGALVAVNFNTYAQGHRQLSPDFYTVAANDHGDFRIANVPPGHYYLKAEPRRVPTTSQSREPAQTADVTTYYPDALDETGARALDLTGGGELRGIDIKLRRERVYSVRGKVVDRAANSARGNVSLTLSKVDGKGGLPFFFRARADGTFEFFNLSPASYVIQSLPGEETVRMEVTITGASLDGLELPVSSGYDIAGTVDSEDGDLKALIPAAALTGPSLSMKRAVAAGTPPPFSISLVSPVANSMAFAAAIKPDGTFRFPPLPAGSYFLNITGVPEGSYVKSAKLGDRDLIHARLNLSPGDGGTLAVVLSSKAADLSGTAGASGAIVTVWPKVPEPASVSGGVKQAYADQTGAFKIMGLAPGEYYVAAWDELEPGLWQGGEFLGRFNADAVFIKVEESAHVALDPKMISRERYAAELAKL